MRRAWIIAGIVGVTTLCACERSTPVESRAAARLTLPDGFTYEDDAQVEHGELDIAGRFIVENRRGAPIEATLRMRDWGVGLDEVEGETIEVTIPARGRVSTDWIGRRARKVSMRLEGDGMISQSHHSFEYMGARVVVDQTTFPQPRVRAEIFTPALEDQLPGVPWFTINQSDPESPGTLRVGDFFRVVNETGVAIPVELRFETSTDNRSSITTTFVVVAAHGECTVDAAERFGAVTITKPTRPLHADSMSTGRTSLGPARIRDGRVLKYRIGGKGERGEILELAIERD